ncbi:MAG: AraC family transcriptional regulator [Alicyclobacillus herbarius]|uniref:AraC family transcriptional regulator n=1 Tax=Alicyclobacillus herbarius TaxID=122960 RepID=UPI0023524295|nr:AraC family transcriptional regulator [Alicyclobacillus herbarius]MCL6631842.1 AraC family transcriptional regulator [Alicyclobacillus herbarius]
MRTGERNHLVTTEWEQRLPLHIDSVGVRPHQEEIVREHGFFAYHWLHTVRGIGEFVVYGKAIKLPANRGILLSPNTPHRYHAVSPNWTTWFLTFDGVLAHAIVSTIGIPTGMALSWDADTPLARIHEHFDTYSESGYDYTGLNGSIEVYTFLIHLRKYGRVNGQSPFAKWHEKLIPVLTALETEYANPNVGLAWMAGKLGISPQRVNTLFKRVFGVSAYQYVLQFRIAKAKELLFANGEISVQEIARRVGFYDASHFISTFRRFEGLTPEQYRGKYLG